MAVQSNENASAKDTDSDLTAQEKKRVPDQKDGQEKQPVQETQLSPKEPIEGTAERELPQGELPVITHTDDAGKEHRHHQSAVFNDLLKKTAPDLPESGKAYKHPLVIDFFLAAGLLLAVAGFTLGAVKIYLIHEAKHDITNRRYAEAIAVLKGDPLPGFFQVEGENPQDLLDQARYLEAIEKLDRNDSDQSALSELDLIRPGSRFFEMANNIKGEHSPASPIVLQGGTEHEATAAEVKGAERPILPDTENSN